jgi:hypothetical protein
MLSGNPLFPEEASTIVSDVDKLYFLAVAVTAFFALLVVISVVVFAIKHRERTSDRVGAPITGLIPLELGWSIVPFFSSMAIFGWATVVFFDLVRAPDQTVEIYATGIDRVIVEEPNEYQTWLSGRAGGLSILTPRMRLVAGHGPVMSTFQDQVNEEGLISLVEYIKSLPSGPPVARD